MGVGAGWNLEEMRNHGTDPRTRMTLLCERVEAMKEIWTHERAEYHGELVDFDPIFSWPKPVQDPHPPVLVGGNGSGVLDRVVSFGDGWMPGHQRDLDGLGARIQELQRRARAAGRGPMPVSIYVARPEFVEKYESIGAARAIFLLTPGPLDDVLEQIAGYADAMSLKRNASEAVGA